MKKNLFILFFCFSSFLIMNCQSDDISDLKNEKEQQEIIDEQIPKVDPPQSNANIKILSLGDSYTIGESVCNTCRFPEQLKDSISKKTGKQNITLEIIARTGWTTTALKNAISSSKITEDQDLVTLLIGVNNQFQGVPFETFQTEFPQLVSSAIKYAKGKSSQVIVVSIPDYAFTPYGKGNKSISDDLNRYNNFIETYCKTYSISYIYITGITRKGLEQPNLVASDGLHPSKLAYSKFVERILPVALDKLNNVNN